MKKSKQKSLVKSAKKDAKNTIEKRIIAGLTEAAGDLGSSSKKLAREIAKSAKHLAKKLSKEINIDKTALVAGTKETKAEISPKPVKAKSTNPIVPAKATPAKKTAAPDKSPAPAAKAAK